MINTPAPHHVSCAAGRKPKTQQSAVSDGSPDLGIKKKPREGKGMFSHLFFKIMQRVCIVSAIGNRSLKIWWMSWNRLRESFNFIHCL